MVSFMQRGCEAEIQNSSPEAPSQSTAQTASMSRPSLSEPFPQLLSLLKPNAGTGEKGHRPQTAQATPVTKTLLDRLPSLEGLSVFKRNSKRQPSSGQMFEFSLLSMRQLQQREIGNMSKITQVRSSETDTSPGFLN